MKEKVCTHAWIPTGHRGGDSHRCVQCGIGIRCDCSLRFNAFSPMHQQGCPMRGKVASA